MSADLGTSWRRRRPSCGRSQRGRGSTSLRSEGVLGTGEGAGPHVLGVRLGSVEEYAGDVGVLLHEAGHLAGPQAERVLPDQDLAVGLVAGPDADGGDAELARDL